jgi:hypothetical protein
MIQSSATLNYPSTFSSKAFYSFLILSLSSFLGTSLIILLHSFNKSVLLTLPLFLINFFTFSNSYSVIWIYLPLSSVIPKSLPLSSNFYTLSTTSLVDKPNSADKSSSNITFLISINSINFCNLFSCS